MIGQVEDLLQFESQSENHLQMVTRKAAEVRRAFAGMRQEKKKNDSVAKANLKKAETEERQRRVFKR